MLTFGSLFAGIGGIDLGLERAGMRCAWQVEIDDYATHVLAKHWPNVPRFRDVRSVGAHNLPAVDMLAGGFPCQDISEAGKRAGIDGNRSGLWSEFARLICDLRPRYVLVENVAELLVRGMGTVLGNLAEIGYDAEWTSLCAAYVGAPHRRERVFVVAYPHGQHGTAKQIFNRITYQAIAPQSTGWVSDGRGVGVVDKQGGRRVRWVPDSRVCRMVDGVPSGMDRLRGLGNAVVPQVAEYIGRCILEFEHDLPSRRH
jgi:DNA (cytosine-5)-methyltransferase 1